MPYPNGTTHQSTQVQTLRHELKNVIIVPRDNDSCVQCGLQQTFAIFAPKFSDSLNGCLELLSLNE